MFDEETKKALMEEFFSENREALRRIEKGLLDLETDPGDRERVNAIFRDMHTVKGNCRMMSFPRLEELAHRAETVLDLMRDGHLVMDQKIGTILLGVVDGVGRTLEEIARSGSEGASDFSSIIGALEGFATPASVAVDLSPPTEMVPEPFNNIAEKLTHKSTEPDRAILSCHGPETTTRSAKPAETSSLAGDGDETVTLPVGVASPRETETAGNPGSLESIRLSLSRLDTLMNQVGELGASFNQLKYVLSERPGQVDQILEVHGKQIHWLQEEVIKYRLQPIGRIWEQYHRLVRDLSVETGRKVVLELVGEETEVDRNVLVAINELLGHLIRNAVDHGIEPSGERSALGKPPAGRITLAAEQKHGQILLEIRDDGRGIDPGAILNKALATGRITPEQAASMKEAEIIRLIMAPGFSTAREISRISGRGTGMDVVQAALDKIGGTIVIDSTPGVGSTFRMSIPQTMAIVSALMINDSGETFALPQANVVELVSFYGDDIRRNIEGKMQSPMVRVREKLLPLVPLQRLLRRDGPGRSGQRELERIHSARELHVAILQAQEQLFGLEVGAILGHASLLIKPIDRMFSHIQILAGTAVLPDGGITFLLNVSALLEGSEKRE
ncbi:MAG: chemotaxis protein CheA [Magnetococcales bacterium]|nr:chemotaxis protein CheA [Magnetococcales bacterium]